MEIILTSKTPSIIIVQKSPFQKFTILKAQKSDLRFAKGINSISFELKHKKKIKAVFHSFSRPDSSFFECFDIIQRARTISNSFFEFYDEILIQVPEILNNPGLKITIEVDL